MSRRLTVPILPLRNSVFFPGSVMPISIGRPKTMQMLNSLRGDEEVIGIISQRDSKIDDPSPEELFSIGTTGKILKSVKAGTDAAHLVLQGIERFRVVSFVHTDPYLRAEIETIDEIEIDEVNVEALILNVKKTAKQVVELMPEVPTGAAQFIEGVSNAGYLADLVAANLDVPVEEKMEILIQANVEMRLKKILELLYRKLEVMKLSKKIDTQVKGEMNRTQREYYLRQQLKAIKDELGETSNADADIESLESRLKDVKLPEEAQKVVDKELLRLRQMPTSSSEYTVARTYLEWFADLPWSKQTDDNLDIGNARKVLDIKHYDLVKVKKRILEYLAVRKLKKEMKGPILCMVGPPGVGKTSLGQSIADALGRKFVRISLGGVRDEAEIRGHRRTYVGALPGRIIQGMKKAQTKNPVFMLDEIDKLAHDFRGDPSSALLEVLDPEQNNSFSDHYLEVPFDLSKILFIATANILDPIPPALKDRMEVLELPGYTQLEKYKIATEHLIPKQSDEHGLSNDFISFNDNTIYKIIESYTRESGVRNLERKIAATCRYVAVKVVEENLNSNTIIQPESLDEILGPEIFYSEISERVEVPGIAIGMAWTPTGGDILFIESTKMEGKGNLVLTGHLGDVMKESVHAALSYIRSNAHELGIDNVSFDKIDIHVHVPAGGIPKDGPSAGITMFSSIASLLTGVKVKNNVSMTGEITLRGNVLPIGGVKEKVLAAARAGIKTIILPERNKKDMVDVPDEIKEKLQFEFVTKMSDVLKVAFERPIRPSKKKKKPASKGFGRK